MAYQSVQGVVWPSLMGLMTYSWHVLDADGEKHAVILRAPKTGTLAKVGFRTGLVTTGDTLKVSFQDRDSATGDPDGTPDEYRTVVVATGVDYTWFLTGILSNNGTDGGAKRSVTKGDWLAIVWEFDSYVAGNLKLAEIAGGSYTTGPNYQYYVDHYTGSWAKQSSQMANVALVYDDDSVAYLAPTLPTKNLITVTFNSGDNPDEIALYFSVPVPCKVDGAWAYVDLAADADLVIYDSDGSSVLGTTSLDKDGRSIAASGLLGGMFASEITLAKDVNYRLSLKPGVGDVVLRAFEVDQAAYLGQCAGGTAWHWSERTDAGAWSQTTTKRPFMGLGISALDDGVGGGGGLLVHPGMSGGFRG